MEYKLPMSLSIADYFRKCIIEESIAAEAPAVVAEDGHTVSLTFASLDSLSTKLAKALRLLKDCDTSNISLFMTFIFIIYFISFDQTIPRILDL